MPCRSRRRPHASRRNCRWRRQPDSARAGAAVLSSVRLQLRQWSWIRSCGGWSRRTRLSLSDDGMRGLLCGLLDESFGCGGPTLASELGQSQLSDVIQRTRVQWELFDYSNRPRTVSNANPAYVTAVFQPYGFETRRRSAGILPGVPKSVPDPVEGAPPPSATAKRKTAEFC